MSNSDPGPYGGGAPPGYPPPGAPPGYPQGGYSPQGPTPGAGGPPPRKPNIGLIVGLGCLGLLVVGGAAAATGYFVFVRSTRTALEHLPEAPTVPEPASAVPVNPNPVPIPALPPAVGGSAVPAAPATSAAAPPRATAGAAVPSAKSSAATPSTAAPTATTAAPTAAPTTSTAPAAGPSAVCAKAIACCKLIAGRAPVGGLGGNCDALRSFDDATCQQSLNGSRQAATALGITCN